MSVKMQFNMKPPKFRGRSNEDIDGFLAKLTAYFGQQAATLTDTEKAYIVCQCLDEAALGWVKNELEKYPTKLIDTTGAGGWRTYDEFLSHLRAMHKRYYDPKEDATNRVLNLKQGNSSILTYNQAFTVILTRLDRSEWKDEPLLAIYKKGLSKHIYYRLAGQTGSNQWKLTDWMNNVKSIEQEEHNIKARDKLYMPHWESSNSRSKEPQYEPMDIDVDKHMFRQRPQKKFKK